ncbi:hypothetical protein Tco_1383152 [Tanacetum coccineum]
MTSPHCFAIVEKASEVQSSSGRPKIPSQVARSLMWRSFVHGLRDLNKVRRVVLIRAFAVEVVSGKFRRSVSPPRFRRGGLSSPEMRCNIRILSNLCNDSCSVSNEAENTINVGNKIGFNMDGKKNKVTSILANGEHAVDQ